MFDRPHHQRIARVLSALDGPLLLANGCLFGGGTAIALRHGEYRESVDIDFLVSDAAGYRALRQLLTGAGGIANIIRPGAALEQLRDMRADQHGIRSVVGIDGAGIKVEIVREARIALDAPGPNDRQCGIATLTPLDMATSKLLANADRWADDSVFSRDLIDLAMLQPGVRVLGQAREKAKQAYGESVDTDLARAIEKFLTREGWMVRCMQMMAMTTTPPALLRQRVKALQPKPAVARSKNQ